MLKKPDYSTWLTKQQTADTLNVSTKQIERFAHAGRLQCARWKRPQGGPVITVYHPTDVERIGRERTPDGEPFVLPRAAEEKPAPEKSNGITVRQPSAEQFMQALAAVVSGASQTSATLSGVRLAERLCLTLGEAAEFTGYGVGYLRKQITAGKLELLKGAGPRRADVVRRVDLEKL
jgi:hypothetical protein